MHARTPPAKGGKPIIAAADMLRRMFPPGARIQLASYANTRGDPKFPARHKTITEPDDVAAFIEKWDEPGRALYFAVNPIKGTERGKEHVAQIICAHADIDLSGIVEDANAVKAALAKLPLKPSIVVMSGHGFHCYWFFDEPLPPGQIPSHEDRLRRLCAILAADTSVAEAARVLRLPGSHNSKGGDNIEVQVLDALSSWQRYSPGEIDMWIDRAEPVLTYRPKLREAARGTGTARNIYQLFGDKTKRSNLDIDDALAKMEMHDTHGRGIDDTMTRVVGKMVSEGETVDAVIETMLEPVRLVFERDRQSGDGTWNEKTAIRNIKSKFRYLTKRDERKADNADDDDDAGATGAKAKKHLIETSEQFTSNFIPPDYLVDGVILCGFMYSLTALTGHCKTAVLLLLSAMVARGRDFADNETKKGRVLYLAGENPDDVRMRWLAMAEHMNFDVDTIDVCFIPGTFDIAKMEKRIAAEVETLGGVALVIIDTGPAFFQGDAENDNVDMLAHAKMMRRLISLPGKPTVIAATHPTKNATKDNLVPRGGGAFLNELDGNLTAWREETLVTLHHGKLRGAPFEPMPFEWESVTADKLVDSKGRHMPTVLVRPLSAEEQKERFATRRGDEDEVLALLLGRKSPTSLHQMADELVWNLKNGRGPNKAKVQRIIDKFKKDKLVKSDRDGSCLTKEGIAAAEKVLQQKPHLKDPK